MFINASRPRAVWGEQDLLRGGGFVYGPVRQSPGDNYYDGNHDNNATGGNSAFAQQLLCSRLNQITQHNYKSGSATLSRHPRQAQHQQQRRQHPYLAQLRQHHRRQDHMMEGSKGYPQMADSGDEYYFTEDMYGNDCFSGIPGLSTPNDGSNGAPAQTTAGYNVSGRDLGPSHNQDHSQYLGLQQQHHNKGAALENDSHPFHWPHFTTTPTNMSPLDHGNFDSRHYSMAMFDHMPADLGYAGLQHGLPGATGSNWVEPDMPLLGESVLCNRFSPTGTAYSSFSSTGSIVGTSMTLNSMGAHTGRGELNMTCPSTVSPKMLQNNPSPAPTSSSESVHTSFMSTGDEFPSNSFLEQHGVPSVVPSSKRATHRARKELPDKSKSASRHLSAPSDHSSSAKGKASISNHRHQQQQQTLAHRSKLHDIKPKPADGSTLASMPDSNPDPVVTAQTIERNKKDEFLIKSKLAGMTYREIRRKGNFSEAESTLRGRFRTLTKHKEARVRKPEWTENDLRVLRKAVRKFAKGEDPTTSKIPWKQVAEYIDNNGGSYLFGNATCRKRWDELVAQGKAFK